MRSRPERVADEEAIETWSKIGSYCAFRYVLRESLTKKRLRLNSVRGQGGASCVLRESLTKKRLRLYQCFFVCRRFICPERVADEEAIETLSMFFRMSALYLS